MQRSWRRNCALSRRVLVRVITSFVGVTRGGEDEWYSVRGEGKRRNKVGEVQRGGSNDAIRRVMQNDVILRSGVTVLSQGQHVQGPAPSDPFPSRPSPPFLDIAWKPAPLVVVARARACESVSLFLCLSHHPMSLFFLLLLSFPPKILVREASLVFFVIRANKVHCR